MINVEELTAKIEEQGKRNVVEKENKRKLYLQSLRRKVEIINGYREDAETLVKIFKALKSNGLEYSGEHREYIADGWSHHIGFVEFKDGTVCLRVCGSGYCGNNQLLFLRDGNDAECAYYEGNETLIGDVLKVVDHPEHYGITDRWLGFFEERLDTMIEGFEKFRDDYIAYAQSQLKK